ncbi:hypothetical protein EVG20_g9664 [Dentipellis fragilis]|uniref:t-SNARE coiled-coil homology domain-containing protein n=1 Tax=Dentipellis fragilis TaxID=205917 RepID=A0A4Y9XYW0_9AGAM|nr:hypothetical protein EVG20_g9664 [Dentipellis fragilis]
MAANAHQITLPELDYHVNRPGEITTQPPTARDIVAADRFRQLVTTRGTHDGASADAIAAAIKYDVQVSGWGVEPPWLRPILIDMEQRLGKRMDAMEKRLGERIDGMEQRLGERVDSMGQKVDAMGQSVDDVGQKLDEVKELFDKTLELMKLLIISSLIPHLSDPAPAAAHRRSIQSGLGEWHLELNAMTRMARRARSAQASQSQKRCESASRHEARLEEGEVERTGGREACQPRCSRKGHPPPRAGSVRSMDFEGVEADPDRALRYIRERSDDPAYAGCPARAARVNALHPATWVLTDYLSLQMREFDDLMQGRFLLCAPETGVLGAGAALRGDGGGLHDGQPGSASEDAAS